MTIKSIIKAIGNYTFLNSQYSYLHYQEEKQDRNLEDVFIINPQAQKHILLMLDYNISKLKDYLAEFNNTFS